MTTALIPGHEQMTRWWVTKHDNKKLYFPLSWKQTVMTQERQMRRVISRQVEPQPRSRGWHLASVQWRVTTQSKLSLTRRKLAALLTVIPAEIPVGISVHGCRDQDAKKI